MDAAAPPRVAAVALQQNETPFTAAELGLLTYELFGAALGVVIAYLAYRGYRRNDSRPMLFVSLGFALALGVPLVATVAFVALPVPVDGVTVQVLTQTVEVAGLLCIIHGLRL